MSIPMLVLFDLFDLQVPDNEVDRMHIRDNLKAVTVSAECACSEEC